MAVHISTERDVEEWERLWNNLDRVLDRGNGDRLSAMIDLNGRNRLDGMG